MFVSFHATCRVDAIVEDIHSLLICNVFIGLVYQRVPRLEETWAIAILTFV